MEYARRWLLINRGYTFADVPMAYDIMDLEKVTIQTGERRGDTLPLRACRNGGRVLPEEGSMLIWDRAYGGTGHVAIVIEVTPAYVKIAEQNFDDLQWAESTDYSRELKATLGGDGAYTVHDSFPLLGWMVLPHVQDPTPA